MNNSFFELLRVALGTQEYLSQTHSAEEWQRYYNLAERQGVVGVCFGALTRLSKEMEPPFDLKIQWIGMAELYRQMYELHKQAIEDLAAFYQSQSLKMLLMKGYGLSLDYPVPEHRPVGDIDIYLFGYKEFADQIVEQRLGLKVKRKYRKHSHFTFQNVMVENHETFIDDDKHKSNVRFEKILEEEIKVESLELGESPIQNCHLPSATWNALFLLRHAGEHFTASEITLRHVLDLGTFFQAHHKEIDWAFVLKVYKDENMMRFYDTIATICVRNLGIEAEMFCGYHHNVKLADMVLADIFAVKEKLPNNEHDMLKMGKLKYGVKKSLYWWKNRWKYKIIYKESLWNSFWTLARNRISMLYAIAHFSGSLSVELLCT